MSVAAVRPLRSSAPEAVSGAGIDGSGVDTALERLDGHLRRVVHRHSTEWSAVDRRLGQPLELLGRYLEGGKRLRPMFFLCGHVAAGGDPLAPEAMDVAAALELLHAFAILHDDVIDGSDRRRGRPALHVALADDHRARRLNGDGRRYGDGMAVLVGDLALTCADRLLGSVCAAGRPGTSETAAAGRAGTSETAAADAAGSPVITAEVALAVRQVWDDLRTELVMGEFLDVTAAAEGRATPGEALVVARYKSGAYTVERPLHLGAALAGRFDELGPALSRFGQPLGEAFQLRDDLLGVYGAAEVTGKPVGEDLREGKQTLLVGLGRQMASAADQPLLARIGAADLTAQEVAAIAALLDRCGARRAVEHQIERRHDSALAALAAAPIAETARRRLADLAERTLWRTA